MNDDNFHVWRMFRIQGDDRENEIEDNLQAIDCMVSNLRNMAVDMSAEISDQNEQLERITLKVKLSSLEVVTRNICGAGSLQWEQGDECQQEGRGVIEKLTTLSLPCIPWCW